MTGRVTWPDVERALRAGTWPDWRGRREWHGPCPDCGGRDRAALHPHRDDPLDVGGGCRGCSLTGLDLARRLLGLPDLPSARPFPARVPKRPRRTRSRAAHGDSGTESVPQAVRDSESLSGRATGTPARRGPGRGPTRLALPFPNIWRAGVPADRTAGADYLVRTRRVWPADLALPAAVRWLPADRAAALRPRLPDRAAGALLYRYADGADGVTVACEAVTLDGAALDFGGAGKRPNLNGSRWDGDGGRRVFVARGIVTRVRDRRQGRGNPTGEVESVRGPHGVHVCEGPVDALALVHLAELGAVDLAGAAVIGVQCAGRMLPGAVADWPGPVTAWPDPNEAGERAAGRLAAALPGRVRVRWRAAGPGRDVADWAAEAALEREAVRDDGRGGRF